MVSEEAQADIAFIDAKVAELRLAVGDFRKRHNMFYPGMFDGAPNVPRAELLTNCRVLNDRHEILKHVPPGGRFAEVGTMYGDLIVRVLEICKPSEVHVFDYGMNNIKVENKAKLDAFGKVSYYVGDSSENMAKMPDEFFDVIYVDADHSFAGVWKDLMQAFNLQGIEVRIVIADDIAGGLNFFPPYGVFSAVNKFANENNFRFEYLGLSPFGFHDVALRRW
jgi:hypothetical protein